MIGNGLPSYTVPPATGSGLSSATYGTPASKPYPGFPSALENIDMTQPVSSEMTQPVSIDMTQPVSSDMTQPVPTGTFYGAGANPTTSGVPQQRGDAGGTVYGTGGYPSIGTNYSSIDMTMPVNIDPVENSGSLTGHILAQGWHDAPVDQRRSNFKVVVAMLAVLGLLVTISLIFVFTAGDAFTDMVKNFAN